MAVEAVQVNAMNAAELNAHLAGDLSVTTTWGLFTTVTVGERALDKAEVQEISKRAMELTSSAFSRNAMGDVADLNGRIAELSTAVSAERSNMWTIARWVMAAINFVFGDSFQGLFFAQAHAEKFNSFVEMLSGDEREAFLGQIYQIERALAEVDAEANAARLAEMNRDGNWAGNNLHTISQETLERAFDAVVAGRPAPEAAAEEAPVADAPAADAAEEA